MREQFEHSRRRGWILTSVILAAAIVAGSMAGSYVKRGRVSRWIGIDDLHTVDGSTGSFVACFAAAMLALALVGLLSRRFYTQPALTALLLAVGSWMTLTVVSGFAFASMMSGTGSGSAWRALLVMVFLTLPIVVTIVRFLPERGASSAPALAQAVIALVLLTITLPRWGVLRRVQLSPRELDAVASKTFGTSYQFARDLVRSCEWVNVHVGGLKELTIAPDRRNELRRFTERAYRAYFDFDYVGGSSRGRIRLHFRHEHPDPRAPFTTTGAEVRVMISPEGGDAIPIPADCPIRSANPNISAQ